MEKVLSAESLMVMVTLLLPGFVFGRVKAWTTQKVSEEAEGMATTIYLNLVRSLLILALICPISVGFASVHAVMTGVIGGDPATLFKDWHSAWVSMLLILGLPGGLGFFMGALEINEVPRKLRHWSHLPPVAYKQAWDVAFATLEADEPGFVYILEIEKKQGPSVFGLYGKGSAASKSGGYRDVFLEDQFIAKEGALVSANTGGILCRGADISAIRFLKIPA